jgi:hypothetical protein
MRGQKMPSREGGRDRPPYNETMASDLSTRAGLAKYMAKDNFEISWKLSSPSITCNLIHQIMAERNYSQQTPTCNLLKFLSV